MAGLEDLIDPQGFNESLREYAKTEKGGGEPVVLFILGVPGIGKSFTIRTFTGMYPAYSVTMLGYGDVMWETAQEKFPDKVKDRDDMRSKLSKDEQESLRDFAAEKLAEKCERGDGKTLYFIDTHATIETPKGYLVGIPPNVFNAVRADGLILMEDTPEGTASRRMKDNKAGTRRRDPNLESIKNHQEVNHAIVDAISGACGCAAIYVDRAANNGAEDDSRDIKAALDELR